MSNKKKGNNAGAKTPYFKEIYEQMLADETKDFWDLSPVENTLLGRTVSHVIFRSIGVDISKYLTSKTKDGAEMPSLTEGRTAAEVAEMEFLSAWNNLNQSYTTLQLEALSFRSLINCRDYQLWLVETLSRIPLAQWEKARAKFTKTCGNPVYIAGYLTWLDTLRNRSYTDGKVTWLPYEEMTSLEKYVISRTIRSYEMDDELKTRVDEWRSQAKKHGYLAMSLTQGRVSMVYNSNKALGYMDFGLTDTGLEYYENSVVLWGLWSDSIAEIVTEEADTTKIMASLANSLVNGVNIEVLGRLRASFINDWSRRNQTHLEEAEESRVTKKLQEAEEENSRLKRELTQAKDQIKAAEKEIKAHKENNKALEEAKNNYAKKCDELTASLKAVEKKLARALEAPKSSKTEEATAPVSCLEKKVCKLEEGLLTANRKIDDLYTLLSADNDEEADLSTDAYEDTDNLTDLFEGAAQDLAENGRLIINGGAKAWQARVRKWFEDQGVKVRTYELGETITGLRPTDTVILNVIQNKHKYSVKFMDDVRSVGAKLVVCNVNNIEQTLRIVFDHPERRMC